MPESMDSWKKLTSAVLLPQRRNGAIVSEDFDKAEVMNNYFCSVFTTENLSNIGDTVNATTGVNLITNSDSYLSTFKFTIKNIVNYIKALYPTVVNLLGLITFIPEYFLSYVIL